MPNSGQLAPNYPAATWGGQSPFTGSRGPLLRYAQFTVEADCVVGRIAIWRIQWYEFTRVNGNGKKPAYGQKRDELT